MRLLLFTGKGGVGKSTVAAGTAALAASRGLRTLVISTDTAHSLGDAFGAVVQGEPQEVAPSLFVQQVDAQRQFERSWTEIQGYLRDVLDVVGVDPVAAEELTVLPGAEEVLALLELRVQALSGRWDVVVVDCAPTAETLRLLALPEALNWYMRRLFPAERRVMRALRPVLSKAAGVPMPQDAVFDAVERLHGELAEVQQLLSGPDASVRIVLTPERMVLAEARRSWTSLSLYGYTVDGVVANRLFPLEGADEWRRGWAVAQSEVMAEVRDSFGQLSLWTSPYREREPLGLDELRDVAERLYGDDDPFARSTLAPAFSVTTVEGGAVLTLALPQADRAEVDLARSADDLVVSHGSYRRVLTLPAVLARMTVRGAQVVDGTLRVTFGEEAP
ncbi:ArsA family ATPase [Nocardioides gilvus]|uniref:ArsA family ATPase n=1 Tax=Nocardioides gilvus TaxID=1735589 RepID=UPI000D740720|nr:ArsA family ATPase [Nocardioides gilvus]